jgi:hypothetical protein
MCSLSRGVDAASGCVSTANRLGTATVPGTAKSAVLQGVWAVSAYRFSWSCTRRIGTHNPLVAGSSPARPTETPVFRLRVVYIDRGCVQVGVPQKRQDELHSKKLAPIRSEAVAGVSDLQDRAGVLLNVLLRPWLTLQLLDDLLALIRRRGEESTQHGLCRRRCA